MYEQALALLQILAVRADSLRDDELDLYRSLGRYVGLQMQIMTACLRREMKEEGITDDDITGIAI